MIEENVEVTDTTSKNISSILKKVDGDNSSGSVKKNKKLKSSLTKCKNCMKFGKEFDSSHKNVNEVKNKIGELEGFTMYPKI